MSSNNSGIALKYHALPPKSEYTMIRYIWLDGNGRDLRSKSNYAKFEPKSVEEVPLWCYCGQTCGHMKLLANSDCWLRPVLLCNDPFREHSHKSVYCIPNKFDIPASIHRIGCESLYSERKFSKIPAFTIRQSYIVLDPITKKPIGWPFDDYDSANPKHSCGVGANRAVARDLNEAFYKACLYAGLTISATQSEDIPALWSFELGPTQGISIGDELWMARFILQLMSEQFNRLISIEPLKHDKSVRTSLDIWTEDRSSFMSFPINTDPYIALKTITELI